MTRVTLKSWEESWVRNQMKGQKIQTFKEETRCKRAITALGEHEDHLPNVNNNKTPNT